MRPAAPAPTTTSGSASRREPTRSREGRQHGHVIGRLGLPLRSLRSMEAAVQRRGQRARVARMRSSRRPSFFGNESCGSPTRSRGRPPGGGGGSVSVEPEVRRPRAARRARRGGTARCAPIARGRSTSRGSGATLKSPHRTSGSEVRWRRVEVDAQAPDPLELVGVFLGSRRPGRWAT